MTGTHIFEECLVLWVGGWPLSALHALQLLLPWFARTMTDQRRLLHETSSAFWKWSKGLGLFLRLWYTSTTGATCCACATAVRTDTACGWSGLGACKRRNISKVYLSFLILDIRNVTLQDVHWSQQVCYNQATNQLVPWSKVLLAQSMVTQLVKKFQ
jgi:hypothetical protein